ncbi:hypothetical protein CYY_002676 [Polysphondylium violaceum]|uniref:GH16 domain-containing protein n=1 Tax=Polysphondylium violaceum TaxID=133409 RepID=A0A8J4Q7M8_9MYCE|nr:hypothetical protein CYY_002676 [Polysphondylium violaceum]
MGRKKFTIYHLFLIIILSISTVYPPSSSLSSLEDVQDEYLDSREREYDSDSYSHQLHFPCATSFSDSLNSTSNFEKLTTTNDNKPYQCNLDPNYVNFINTDSKTVLSLTIDAMGCPKDCKNLKFSCARVDSINKDLTFGSYSCVMRVSKSSHVINICAIHNGGIGDGASEIYMKYQYPSFYLGYETFGKLKTSIEPLVKKDIDLDAFHNFTISFRNTSVIWYLNGLELTQRGGSIPVPPMSFYCALFPDPEMKNYNTSLEATALVDTLSYRAICDEIFKNDNYSLSSIPQFYRDNCTTSRDVIIFNDTLDNDWHPISESFKAVPDTKTTFQRHGSAVISFEIRQESKPFYLSCKKQIPVTRHKYFTFWINGGELGNQDIKLELYNTNYSITNSIASISLSTFLRVGLQPNTWNKAMINMLELQANPSNITTFNVFSFRAGHDEYMGQCYIDDIKFANSTACINEKVAFFKNGHLQNGADGNYSTGSIHFNTKIIPYRNIFDRATNRTQTISFAIISSNCLNLSFQNGTLKVGDYYAFQIFYTQASSFGISFSQDVDIPPLSLQVCIQIGNITPPCIGLSEYMGGKFPSGIWVKLTIPFEDLCAWGDAEITSLIFKTTQSNYQGTLAIGSVEVGKRVEPPIRSHLQSVTVKNLPLNSILTLSLSFLLCLI